MQYIINLMCICYAYSYLNDVKVAYLYIPNNEKRYVEKVSDENYQNVEKDASISIDSFRPNKRKNHDPGIPLLHRYLHRNKINRILSRRANEAYNSVSTSFETEEFKRNFMASDWLKAQVEALDNNMTKGDTVNLLAARPLGVHCHDPGQAGSAGICVLELECVPELRIYRGDSACGRGEFGCCSIMETTFDVNEPIGLSFESLSNESPTDKKNKYTSKEKERIYRLRHKQERRKLRKTRKKKMKKYINRIVLQLHKTLKRIYQNKTKQKVKKTREMKLYMASLKEQFKKDRLAVKDFHTIEVIKIDAALKKKINEIKYMTENYLTNETLRHIVLGETKLLTGHAARILVDAYPELDAYVRAAPKITRTVDEASNAWSSEIETIKFD